MPGEIMLFGVNRKTKRSRKTAKRARSHNRRKTAAPKRRRRTAKVATIFASNPKRRKRRSVIRFKRNPKRRRSVGSAIGIPSGGNIMNMVKVATIAAAGGVLLDIGYNYLPVPANLKTGPVSHLVKGAGAILLAMGAKRFVGAKMANELAFGALTVTLYGALRAATNTALPQLQLGLYDDLGLYLDGGLHQQGGSNMAGLGYYGAGMTSGSSIMSAGAPMELQGEFKSF